MRCLLTLLFSLSLGFSFLYVFHIFYFFFIFITIISFRQALQRYRWVKAAFASASLQSVGLFIARTRLNLSLSVISRFSARLATSIFFLQIFFFCSLLMYLFIH